MARDPSQRLVRVVEALDPQPGDRVDLPFGEERFDQIFAVHVAALAREPGLSIARGLLTPRGVVSLFDQTIPGAATIVRTDFRRTGLGRTDAVPCDLR